MNTDIENTQLVFQTAFKKCLGVYRLSMDKNSHVFKTLRNMMITYNPLEVLNSANLKGTSDLLNRNEDLRDFFNRVYFNFRVNVTQEDYESLLKRLSEGLTLRHGNASVVPRDYLFQLSNATDIHEVLFSNPQLVIMMLILSYGDITDVNV